MTKSGRSWIAYRRQYLNDRSWFGLGFIAGGFGDLSTDFTPWRLDVILGLLGVGLLVWGVAAKRTPREPCR